MYLGSSSRRRCIKIGSSVLVNLFCCGRGYEGTVHCTFFHTRGGGYVEGSNEAVTDSNFRICIRSLTLTNQNNSVVDRDL